MQCLYPFYLQNKYTISDASPRGLLIPCGKCLACRIARAREWSVRLIHELDSWDKACFLTLTYDDNFLPHRKYSEGGILLKADLQLYFKRIRRKDKIKYFACGEYGEKTIRPHYHAIVFGYGPQDSDYLFKAWDMCDRQAFHVGTVTMDSCSRS